jgi:cell division protein FtsN
VYLPPVASRAAADKRIAELKQAGHKDLYVVDGGSQRFTISLGAFRTEDAANALLATLAVQGIRDAKVGPRQQAIAQTMLVIRDPPQPAVARMRDLMPAYPGAELRIGTCEKPA